MVRLVVHAPAATVYSAEGIIEECETETFPNLAVLVEWTGSRFIINGVDSDTTT